MSITNVTEITTFRDTKIPIPGYVLAQDHPDFVGGTVWSRSELEALRTRDEQWKTAMAAAVEYGRQQAMASGEALAEAAGRLYDPANFTHVCNLWVDPETSDYIVDRCDHDPKECVAAYVRKPGTPYHAPGAPDPQLCYFYQVETYPDLVKKMDEQIRRLQLRLMSSSDPMNVFVGSPRAG